MSLVDKFHSGLLNVHNDIILQMCNQLDNKCQIVENSQIKSDTTIPRVLLQQLEDRLNALEKINSVCNNDDKTNNNIENILQRLTDIESENIERNNIYDTSESEIIKRLNIVESNIGGSSGCTIGYSIYCSHQPSLDSMETKAKKRLEDTFVTMSKCEMDKLHKIIESKIDKKSEVENVVDPLIALTNLAHPSDGLQYVTRVGV